VNQDSLTMASELSSSSSAAGDATTSEVNLRRPYCGQLSKFTNVVKGWQYRWFVLDGEAGRLDYYLNDDKIGGQKKSRGSQYLAGALVLPSDEDSTTFGVNFASGESFKLRAANVKERQMWVDRIRAAAQKHEGQNVANSGSRSLLTANGEPGSRLQHLELSALDALGSCHDILHQTELKNRELCAAVEALPSPPPRPAGSGAKAELAAKAGEDDSGPRCLDEDMLLMKATSNAALLALDQALAILQDIRDARMPSPTAVVTTTSASHKSFFPSSSPKRATTKKPSSSRLSIPAVSAASTLSLPADLRAQPAASSSSS